MSLAGCTPSRHADIFYDRDYAQIRAMEERAVNACRVQPPRPFTTDGCSMFPDGSWGECCVEHDVAYWCGGSAQARQAADLRLQACVAERGYPRMSSFVYMGVRAGGHPWWPFSWRWGYGWDWPRTYQSD